MKRVRLLVLLVVMSGVSCAPTQFYGEPHVIGGRAGCQQKCAAWGMDLTGMVAVGEYSDACVCQVRGAPPAVGSAAAADAAAVAVEAAHRRSTTETHSPMIGH
jgi:hypothetical protein